MKKTNLKSDQLGRGSYFDNYTKKHRTIEPPPKMDENEFKEKRAAYMNENHTKYLAEEKRIGYMQAFPEKEGGLIDGIAFKTECRGYDVLFTVRYGKVKLSKDSNIECYGITTGRAEVAHKLRMNGWGSHCHIDEAEAMEKGIVEMAKKHNLMICEKACSWPHAKAVVQEITESYVRRYEPAKPTNTPVNEKATTKGA